MFVFVFVGMNLDNVDTIQDIEGSFATVSLGTLGLITALAISVILLLQYSAVLPSTIRLRQKRVVSSAAQVSVDRKLDQHPDNQYTF